MATNKKKYKRLEDNYTTYFPMEFNYDKDKTDLNFYVYNTEL